MPGQLVAYPVLDLRRHQPDLHWYLRQLEQVLIDVLAQLGIAGERVSMADRTLARGPQSGRDRRRLPSLDHPARSGPERESCDLSGFAQVTPCGLKGRPVGRLSDWLPGLDPSRRCSHCCAMAIAARFGLVWSAAA